MDFVSDKVRYEFRDQILTGENPGERERLIEQIVEINRTAVTEFLGQFDANALRSYLDHLEAAQRPRGRMARWVRTGSAPATECREARV